MLSVWKSPPGAPGLFRSAPVSSRNLAAVRMDVCAFLGVAPRGPAREPVLDEFKRDGEVDPRVERELRRTVPVAVESFDEYRQHFGGFEGPGLLPYAVASFFEQGGRRAYVARIVHQYGPADSSKNEERVAWGALPGLVTPNGKAPKLRARNEGAWGNELQTTVTMRYSPIQPVSMPPALLTVSENEDLPGGSLLRFTMAGGSYQYRFVSEVIKHGAPDGDHMIREVILDQILTGTISRVELVEAELSIDDGHGREEVHVRQGLSSLHPRWLGATLAYDSNLVFPNGSWMQLELRVAADEPGETFAGGKDGYSDITPSDFFDDEWTLGDDEAGDGAASLVNLEDLSLLVAPDLYSPAPLEPVVSTVEPPSLAGPTFNRCVDNVAKSPELETFVPDLDGLRLDPRMDLPEIEKIQERLVDFVSDLRSFIVLLDVPPGLSQRKILQWRTRFDSAYAAAYFPWVSTARRDDERDALIRVPPSAVAAGIIASSEWDFGVPHGPANRLAEEVISVDELISAERHDELHPQGINIYLMERDGLRLTAARTLSRDPQWRQLSVRRLITMIVRTLTRQTQWMVFEPNNPALHAQIRHLLTDFLRGLYLAGAFRGASEEEAFFVKCDRELNTRAVMDAGQVIAHIGVAPAEPLEFIVLRLARSGDGTLTVEE